MTVRVEGIEPRGSASVPLQLQGRSLLVARVVWAALIAQAVFLFTVSLRARYSQLSHPPDDVRAQLVHVGLPAGIYAAYLTAIGGIFALVCCTVAALIIRHRPADRIGLLASLYLVMMSLSSPPQMQAVVTAYPALTLPANLVEFLFIIVLIVFFFVFPDGRFVPHWSQLPVLGGAVGFLLIFFLTGASVVENPPDWMGLMTVGGGILGIGAQIYRYIRVADTVQRQQTKLVVLGVSLAMVTSIVFTLVGSSIPTIGRPETGYDVTSTSVITLSFLFIPLTLGLAILRSHLWDIDIVINRSLVYSALTVGLLGLYVALVDGVGAVTPAVGHLPISLLATALVAVLFAPLRNRLQGAVNRLMYGERDDPYRVLTRLGERVGAALEPEAVLPTIAETVAQAMKSPHAAITLQPAGASDPEPARGEVDGAPLRLPLEYQGKVVGELLVAPRSPGEEFSPADRRLLADLARQIGPAAHAVHLTADLQRSRERLVTAREEERRRLRRDLHDGLGPQLAALTLKIETIRNRFAHTAEIDDALVDLTARTQAALSDIRRLVYGLRPPALDELGFLSALAQAAAQYRGHDDAGVSVTVDAPQSLPPLPAAVEVAAYRIVEEALTNVVRHAAARTCRLSVWLEDERHLLHLRIVDDGHGFPANSRAGVGLLSMRERAEELGGHCCIASPPAGGTMVTVELPILPADRSATALDNG
jgi:signal transduction histidine kinase